MNFRLSAIRWRLFLWLLSRKLIKKLIPVLPGEKIPVQSDSQPDMDLLRLKKGSFRLFVSPFLPKSLAETAQVRSRGLQNGVWKTKEGTGRTADLSTHMNRILIRKRKKRKGFSRAAPPDDQTVQEADSRNTQKYRRTIFMALKQS